MILKLTLCRITDSLKCSEWSHWDKEWQQFASQFICYREVFLVFAHNLLSNTMIVRRKTKLCSRESFKVMINTVVHNDQIDVRKWFQSTVVSECVDLSRKEFKFKYDSANNTIEIKALMTANIDFRWHHVKSFSLPSTFMNWEKKDPPPINRWVCFFLLFLSPF